MQLKFLMVLNIITFINNYIYSTMWLQTLHIFQGRRGRGWPSWDTGRSRRCGIGCTTSPWGSLLWSTIAVTQLYLFFHVTPSRPPALPRLVIHTRHHRPCHGYLSQPFSSLRRLCRALRCILRECIFQGDHVLQYSLDLHIPRQQQHH
jgi:hypothetical protein